MTTDPGTDPCPAAPQRHFLPAAIFEAYPLRPARRFVLPAAILVPVPARKLHWFAGARRMLTRRGFWVSMLALALVTAVGAVMLYEVAQTPPPSPGTGPVYYA